MVSLSDLFVENAGRLSNVMLKSPTWPQVGDAAGTSAVLGNDAWADVYVIVAMGYVTTTVAVTPISVVRSPGELEVIMDEVDVDADGKIGETDGETDSDVAVDVDSSGGLVWIVSVS